MHFIFSRESTIKEDRLKKSIGKNIVKMEQGNKRYWQTEKALYINKIHKTQNNAFMTQMTWAS